MSREQWVMHACFTRVSTGARFRRSVALAAGWVAAATVVLSPVGLGAQPVANPPAFADAGGVRPLAFVADSVAAFGDTTRALAMLDSAIRKNPRDASLWHRYGLIQWELAKPHRGSSIVWNAQAIKRLLAADSSLSLAAVLEPDSGRYTLDFSRFLLNSKWAYQRFMAQGGVGDAYKTAHRAGDSYLISETATERGIIHWRRFENIAGRALTRDGQPIVIDDNGFNLAGPNTAALDAVAQAVIPIKRYEDENVDLIYAQDFFREALLANPDNMRARRHYYLLMADRERWLELREEARSRTQSSPLDPIAWLALGLAEHRMGNSRKAMPAFDSAFVRLPQADFQRLTTLKRVLRPRAYDKKNTGVADSADFVALAQLEQDAMSRMYWLVADPLAITGVNEHHAEFLARIAFAEIRWTQDDFGVKGADTDRGDIYIRYGPPAQMYNVPRHGLNPPRSIWVYVNGLAFIFDQPESFGTARINIDDRWRVDRLREDNPVNFDNVAVTRKLFDIPVRITRFRAAGDSTDLVVAAAIPFDSLLHNVDLDRASVDYGFRTFDQYVQVHILDSARTSVQTDSARAVTQRYATRLGPGTNVLRVEAFQADTRNGARYVGQTTGLPANGFGMSDVLLSRRPMLREGAGGAPRWRDLDATAVAGTFRAGEPVGLVWEAYELLANRDGDTRYTVNIDIERVTPGLLERVVARVLDGAGQAIGRDQQRGRNRVIASFTRTVPAVPIHLDYVTLDLSGSPPGEYKLSVEIHDLVRNSRTRRNDTFSIVP